jgi:hypothetical protein
VRLEGLGQLKKIHIIGTRTCDLLTCRIVPHPTTLSRAPLILCTFINILKYIKFKEHFTLMFHQCYRDRPVITYIYASLLKRSHVRNQKHIPIHSGLYHLYPHTKARNVAITSPNVTKTFHSNLYNIKYM